MSGWRRQIGGGRQKKTFYLLNLSQTLILQWQVLRRLSINWTDHEWLTACLCLSMCLVPVKLLFTFIRFKGGGCISRQWRIRRRKAGDCVLSLFVAGTLKEANSAYLYLINECCGPNWPGRQQQPTDWVNAAAVAEKDNLCLQYLEIHLKRLCWWSQGKWMQFNLLQTDIVHSNECPSSPHLTDSLSLSLSIGPIFLWSWCAAVEGLLPDWLDCCGRALFHLLLLLLLLLSCMWPTTVRPSLLVLLYGCVFKENTFLCALIIGWFGWLLVRYTNTCIIS